MVFWHQRSTVLITWLDLFYILVRIWTTQVMIYSKINIKFRNLNTSYLPHLLIKADINKPIINIFNAKKNIPININFCMNAPKSNSYMSLCWSQFSQSQFIYNVYRVFKSVEMISATLTISFGWNWTATFDPGIDNFVINAMTRFKLS